MTRPKGSRNRQPSPLRKLVAEEEVNQDGQADVMSLFDDMQTDTYTLIHRMDDITKRWVYHGRLSLNESNEETILERLGGGEYQVRERVRNDAGSYVYGRSRTFKLAGAYKKPTEIIDNVAPKVGGRTDDPALRMGDGIQGGTSINEIMGAGVLQLFQTQAAMQQQQMQAMRDASEASRALLMAAVNQPKTDWVSLLATLLPVVLDFMKSSRNNDLNPLEITKLVTDAIKQNTGASGGMKDAIAAIKELLEVKDMLNGDGASGDPMLDTANKALDLVSAGLAARAGAAPPPASAPPQAASAVPLAPYQQALRANGKRLLVAAQQAKDPELIAEVISEFMPPTMKGVLRELMAREDCAQLVMAEIPGLRVYEMWTVQVCGELQRIMFPDQFPEDEEPGTAEVVDGGGTGEQDE